MKLISCHIENFGKLSGITFDFKDGLNNICESNGWGKSTLAAFIKVMFFGFENERSRDEAVNERKKYKPWQGGTYGGTIKFEAENKSYIIERNFGNKDKEDIFVIRDADTNLVCEDYSENVGNELFLIDSASFLRTVYISQNDIDTATTGSINAKIGNLADNTDDINNFEKVNSRLADLLNNMTPSRKTGSIARLTEKVNLLTLEVKNADELDKAIEENILKKENEQQEQEKLKKEQTELNLKKKDLSKYKDLKALKEGYQRVNEVCEDRKNRLSESRKYFKTDVPTKETVDEIIDIAGQLKVLKSSMDIYRLDDRERKDLEALSEKFANGVPKQEEIDSAIEDCGKVKDIHRNIENTILKEDEENEYSRLSKRFENGITDEHTIELKANNWARKNEIKNSIGVKEANLLTLKNNVDREIRESKKSSVGNNMIFIIIAIFFGIAGIVSLFINIVLGISLVICSVVCCIIYAKKKSDCKKRLELIDRSIDEQYKNLNSLMEEVERDKEFVAKIEKEMSEFLKKFCIEFSEITVINDLYNLRADILAYKKLEAKKKNPATEDIKKEETAIMLALDAYIRQYNVHQGENTDIYINEIEQCLYELKEESKKYNDLVEKNSNYNFHSSKYRIILEKIEQFFDEYDIIIEENIGKQLLEIKSHIQNHEICLTEYKQAEERKKEYIEKNGITQEIIESGIEDIEEISLLDIDERLDEISEKLENINNAINSYNNSLNELREKRDDISEKEEELYLLNEKVAEDKKKYKLIKATKEYLEKAKNSLTSKYMNPILSAFKKYYAIINETEDEEFNIDADINITVLEKGMQRKPQLLSAGMRDLVNLCMRMALIDAMYKGEKPFIILDDTFVNLDDRRVDGGIRFLEEVSKDYQILYFTCHNSRNIN